MGVSFDFNDACLDDLAADPELFDALNDTADAIVGAAASYAPTHLVPTIDVLGSETDEAGCVVYVGTADSFAHLWEFGSINTVTYGFMRAGASDVADSFEPS
jgi:hypothetical protein